ncbi:uncharacterized protein TNCT_211531 [Trichonephila clavata]|uniref:Uncharacterized protein n=1 Tax=Trichonephila clavata TaxID=2740835 RepID=A0A8X6FBB6_TRICU|nr:uncharacterized protein TNCT_113991 [Trichonephila clavata]GFQ80909.1 uncharacterized protein TNCT_199492 [Trichonephila clavata]GFR00487.1 uncharacterized protein TNCT_350031 [Trichonephila clavata]GFR12828.1 uncharacterized protein TNCT_385451 [Trichonephila clavata]GFR15909.1 uncharacterized protein TNCT_636211 [Trichonephila clavata]
MSMLSSFFNVNKAMDIQPNLSKRKLKTPRNSAPRKVAKTAHLLNPPEDDPPKADVPILEALENQPPLLEKLGTNLDNTLPLLEEMDIENPVLEGEPVLKDPPAADHVKLEDPPADHVKLEDPPADHVKLEDPPADPSELDPVALDPVALAGDDAVMVDNYEEPENDEKEEFYPNKTYARKMLNVDKYAVNHVGDQIYNPLSRQYATYLIEEAGVNHKVQFVPRNANGSFNFIKDHDGMILYPFNLTVNFPIFPQNQKGEYMYFRINNVDHYPRNANGTPIYVKNKEGREIPPFNEQNVPFYAKDASGKECYPKDAYGDEYYIWNRKPVFAVKEGRPFYAKDKYQNEFYPVINNREVAIGYFFSKIYAKTASGKEIYPHDAEGNEVILPKLGTLSWNYAKDEDGNAYYPTDKTGEEIVQGDYIYDEDGSFKYPLNREGMPKYEKDDTTHDEVYVIKMDLSINWGVDKNGNQRYAKKENGDEYYPINGEFIYDPSGSPQYARTREGNIIFPLDVERNESYLMDDGGSDVIYMGDVLLDRYAKTRSGEEIYPIQITHQIARRYKEVLLNEKYATTHLQEVKYPLDEYGNEYTLDIPIQIAGKEKDYFPRGYPITNDNWVIVPEVEGKEFISDQLLPKVQATNIIGKLYREGKHYRDYVTNVKSTRLSRAARQKYNIFPYVLGASNPPPLNNLLNPPPVPPNKPLPKVSQPLNWSLIGMVLIGFIYLLYQFFLKATK